MTKTFLKVLGLISITLLLLHCQKQEFQEEEMIKVNENCIIHELIQAPYIMDDTSISYLSPDTFTHIIEGDLITQRLKNNESYEEFQYNENGLLTSTKRYFQGNWTVSDSFFYDNQKLIKKISYSTEGTITREQDLFWEGENLKSGYALSFQRVNGEIESYEIKFNFKYSNGNIIETKLTIYHENGDSLVTRDAYEFDSSENYLNYMTFVPLDFVSGFSLWNAPYWFSENNVTLNTRFNVVDQWTSETSILFTWENGKVIEFVSTSHSHIGSDFFVRPVKISYECW